MVQTREPYVAGQHHPQNEPEHRHRAGLPLGRQRFFDQLLEPKLLEHRGHREQPSVRCQIPRFKVIRRGSPDFIRLWNISVNPLIHGPPAFTLVCIRHHLGELLRIGSRGSQLRVPTVLKQDSQGFPNGPVHYSGNIEHIESQSLYGIAVVKVFLQPTANLEQGIAQITAISQTQLRQLPAGTTPPLIIAYSASSVPVLQLALSRQNLSEQQLNNYALNFIRTQIITVPGASVPYPYGGKQRQVQVDLNPTALQSKGLSALDVVNAISVQNLILPPGTSKIGSREYDVSIPNAAPQTIADLNRIPIKTIGGTTIYIKDVAWVRDGFPPQTNIVRVNGQRSVLLTIQKAGNASTLNVISGIKALLPQIKATLPPQLQIAPLNDQSIFVRGAISGVVRETLIAACLTAFMILVFLGSWRSTVIIATSIPLAILTSIIVLSAIGETINIMTLGGLALAVGILVDDATVEVENINRNREAEPDKDMDEVVLDSASQIATPAFVSTLSICIVFAPMFLLSGVARYLFVPLAEAVVFAMLASYFLSRTIVPTMAKYLLRSEKQE